MTNRAKAYFIAAVAFAVLAITIGCVVGAAGEHDPERDCVTFCASDLQGN